MSTDIGNLMIWEAHASAGNPVCVAHNSDNGLSLSIYRDDSGVVRGVTIWEGNGLESHLRGAVGSIPVEAFEEVGLPKSKWAAADEFVELYLDRVLENA